MSAGVTHYLSKHIKLIVIKHTVKAPLTFFHHWKCPNTWSHQTWSWKTICNICWTFWESWPFSLSCYLFVFFSFSFSSTTLLPAPVTLGCVGPCLTVCARNQRGGAGVQSKLSTSVSWGQINCVKVCVACVMFLYSGCRCRRLVSLTGNIMMSDKQYSWVLRLKRMCSKLSEHVL